jgi:hypothetical protein
VAAGRLRDADEVMSYKIRERETRRTLSQLVSEMKVVTHVGSDACITTTQVELTTHDGDVLEILVQN